MRDGLGGIAKFRCLDAIAIENRHGRIPLEPKLRDVKGGEDASSLPVDRTKAAEVSYLVAARDPRQTESRDGFLGDGAVSALRPGDPAQFEVTRQIETNADVKRILSRIADDRKHLAFYLFMEDMPFGSKKSDSIAKAAGISSKTAELDRRTQGARAAN